MRDSALGTSPEAQHGGRAEDICNLLNEVQKLIRPFIAAADADVETLAEGHGLQIAGDAPRMALVERHPPPELASLLNLTVSSKEPGAEALLAAASDVLKYSVNTSAPGFVDKLYSSPSPPGLAADLLISCLNTNVHVYGVSPALTLIEKHVGAQLATLFGLSEKNAGGVSVPGGAAANTTAMLVARNVRFPRVKEEGFAALPNKLAIFTSDAAHYSVASAAQTLGFGSRSVYKIRSRNDAMDPAALEAAIQGVLGDGGIPFFVSATSGSTVLGAYDDLETIGAIARRHNAWFHVDACWGGGAVFSPKLRGKLNGSQQADSIAFNPHKMLGVPMTTSFLLGRDLRTFWAANRLEAGYLFHGHAEEAQASAVQPNADVGTRSEKVIEPGNPDWRQSPWVVRAPSADSVYDLAQFVPSCGRRADSLKMYLHWRYYGSEGISHHVEASFAGARKVMQLVKASAVLASVGDEEPPCAQACFYYCGKSGRLGMRKDVTRAIVARLETRGWMTDYAPGDAPDEEYLRVVCNRLTTVPVAEGLLKAITEVGAQVEKELGL